MDLLAKLDEACALFTEGRPKAAKAVWSGLPEEFRVRVMKFVLFAFQNTNYLDDLEDAEVQFRTRFGMWKLSRSKIQEMSAAVQKLAQ